MGEIDAEINVIYKFRVSFEMLPAQETDVMYGAHT